MYSPSSNFDNPEQEIVCLMTGESYVYIEGNDLSLIEAKYTNGAIDTLPPRFYRQPFIVRKQNGLRVFGSIE